MTGASAGAGHTEPEPLVVEADGGSRGNPGIAGSGALVRRGRVVLAERAEPLGTASNNVAEYTAMILGLQEAREIDPGARVTVRMDSRLVVEQMSGRWKIKHEDMRRLAESARKLVEEREVAGGSVRFEWIPRARNKAADALSNVAMDGRRVQRRGSDAVREARPPDSVAAGSAPDTTPLRAARPGELSTRRRSCREQQPEQAASVGGRDEEVAPDGPLAETSATGADRGPVGASEAPHRDGAADLGPPTRVVLVRHGVTDYTTMGRLDGRGGGDPPLNAQGRGQAQAVARGVHAFLGDTAVHVISSSLARARQTGDAVATALGTGCSAVPEWDELCFGDWEGMRVVDIQARFPDALAASWRDDDLARPGGESRSDLRERVLLGLQRATAKAGPGGTVVVATHRGPILTVLAHALGTTHRQLTPLATAPASITSLRLWSDGGVQVEFINDTGHLR